MSTTLTRIRTTRTAWLAVLLGLVGGLLAAVAPVSQATAAPAAEGASRGYSYIGSDNFRFWDATGSKVWVQGTMDWYKDGYLAPVFRGQIRNNNSSYVILNTTGCLWVKVTWRKFNANVSWPPSGSVNTVSGGYYRACGPKGTYVYLKGVTHASRALFGATVCIGYSTYDTYTLRRYDACQSMYN